MTEPTRITVKEIAQTMGIGRGRAETLCKRGVIPNIRLGKGHFIISRAAFEAWWRNCGAKWDTVQ